MVGGESLVASKRQAVAGVEGISQRDSGPNIRGGGMVTWQCINLVTFMQPHATRLCPKW